MTGAVNETLGTKTTLQFTTTPELIGGIELTTNGYKLAWSFAEYCNHFKTIFPPQQKINKM